jgi:CheY-like chemotaxis protein/nitrogen-specific signal transduction histidine kinase
VAGAPTLDHEEQTVSTNESREPPAAATQVTDLSATALGQGPFVPGLVHELRNLLAPMGNVVQMLRMRSTGDPRSAPGIAILERQMRGIGHLLDRLAQADHLLRQDLAPSIDTVNLEELLTDTTDALRETFAVSGRRLHVSLAADIRLSGVDPSLLATALRELLENAVQFTSEHGQIWLEANVADGACRIRVRDNGCGIDPARLQGLLAPGGGRQARTGGHRGGLGLGLASAARIAELHGGRLEIASPGPGQGASFTLLLPHANQGEVSAVPTLDIAIAAVPRRRVLIVDDNDAMQNSLTNLLEELGQQVRSARDGEEALRIARDWLPDLVLLDINLPKLNGYRVARELRAQFAPARMAMVMMSGEDPVDALRRGAADVGVDRYIDKMQAGSLLRELLAGNAA